VWERVGEEQDGVLFVEKCGLLLERGGGMRSTRCACVYVVL
jgi:hypothetical protein